jgi:formylglycine-generating enzyme required for sulfatase activity
MKKYDAVVRVDRSAAPAEAKARSWRQLAAAAPRYSSLARTRADDWERFAKEEGVANAAEKRRVAVRDSDWEKVSQFLLLNVVTEVDKERMVSDFLTAYWKSPGIEWAMIEAMGGHVSPNMKKRMRGLAGIEWVTVPGGEFEFGRYSHKDDEYFEDINRKYNIEAKKVRRNVSVGTFQMAKTEVTFKQYGACVLAGVCSAPHLSACWRLGGTSELPVSFRSADHPVVCVDWTQARVFSEWVGGRLPTEAEWEYAARNGGRDLKFPWGNEPESCERASTVEFSKGSNFLEESRTTCCGQEHTWPVCSRTQGNTEQGLCDMAGNVSEWVGDFDQQQDSGLHHAGRVSRGSSCGMIDLVGPGPDRPYEFHGFRPVWRLN